MAFHRQGIRLIGFLAIFMSFMLTNSAKVQGQAANIKDSSIQLFLVSANYSAEMPGGDLADRFGLSHFIGPAGSFKTNSNWLFSLEFDFLIGNNVKENPLTLLETDNNNIINGQGTLEALKIRQRGFRTEIRAGKVFPWFGPNLNSGIFVQLGGGLLQHRLDYKVPSGSVPQLNDDYEDGYDRLTNGFSLTQTIGYLNLSDSRLINFSVAFQITEAFTQNRRDWNFDTRSPKNESRVDLLYGVRVEWSFPIYEQASEGYYYN